MVNIKTIVPSRNGLLGEEQGGIVQEEGPEEECDKNLNWQSNGNEEE